MSAQTAENPHFIAVQPNTGGESSASQHFNENTDPGPHSRQRLLLVQGTGGTSISMAGWALMTNVVTDRDPQLLQGGFRSLVDPNLWRGTTGKVRDAIKRHTDETGMKVDLLGVSDGGRRVARAVIDPKKNFDPEKEVGSLLIVNGPIGDLQGFPQLDSEGRGIRTRAFFGDFDLLVNRLYPKRLQPTNDEVQENVRLPQLTHFDSVTSPVTQLLVLRHLKPLERVEELPLPVATPLRTRLLHAFGFIS